MNKNSKILSIVFDILAMFFIFWAGNIYYLDLEKHYLAPLAILVIVFPFLLLTGVLKFKMTLNLNYRTDCKIFYLTSGVIVSLPGFLIINYGNNYALWGKITVWVVGVLALYYMVYSIYKLNMGGKKNIA